MADFASISNLNTDLVRKALGGSLFIAEYDVDPLTASTLFATGGTLAALPTGWADGGYMTDDGIRFARSTDSEDITAWQSREPVRSDKTSDSETLQVDFEETSKTTIEMYTGADLSNATTTNGALSWDKPAIPQDRYFRLLAIAVDEIDGDELYIARFYPRCRATDYADQAFAKSGALQWGVTFTTYNDPVLKITRRDFIGGPAFAGLRTKMGFAAEA